MKTKIYNLILVLFSAFIFSQVGINTPTPTATLDINGTLKVRETPIVTALPGYQIMAVNLGSFQVAKVDPQIIIDAAANAANTNTTVYSAQKTGGISLLSVTLFSTWKQINFLTTDRTTGSASLFSNTDYSYTVPSTGVYAIGFYFRYGSGLQASLLTGGPGIGIIKNTSGTFTPLDIREFSGLNLGLGALTISEASINSLYNLQAGDKLYFGLTNTGVLGGTVLSSSNASFYIYKVSN
ncbi:hypothetical protein HNP38_000416 [Chryseobacterium defluvii]|uniref:C1q domain-containing protein n=1 Tax=Chryseobacterium defluvii TaxID=160396 RepID=A0A840KBG0_9FLAO|nr:hypothetical protein [Chryseobacterium defluvii]MBB4805144.1 hypothetical protein [Chryseobacterium defluvii]